MAGDSPVTKAQFLLGCVVALISVAAFAFAMKADVKEALATATRAETKADKTDEALRIIDLRLERIQALLERMDKDFAARVKAESEHPR